jgi:hypothetical protein
MTMPVVRMGGTRIMVSACLGQAASRFAVSARSWTITQSSPVGARPGHHPLRKAHPAKAGAAKPRVLAALSPGRPAGILQQWREWRSVTANLRKTCLKPEYASLYPEVPPNIWLGAAGVAARVAARLRGSADSSDRLPKRVLPDEHFEFRGGRRRRQTWRGPGSRLGETSV